MYTVSSGQFQVAGRADLGTIEGVMLYQHGTPVAVLWSVLDRRFYGREKDAMLHGTLKTARAILAKHDNFRAIVDAFCDASPDHRVTDIPASHGASVLASGPL